MALLLVCFWPVGLWLMWNGKLWSRTTRVLVTVLAVVCAVWVVMAAGSGTSTHGQRQDSAKLRELTLTAERAQLAAATTNAQSQKQPQAGNAPQDGVQAPAPVAVSDVDIATLLADYKGNELRADGLYKGRLVRVTGKLDGVEKDILDKPYVAIGTGKLFEIPQIQCFLADEATGPPSIARKERG